MPGTYSIQIDPDASLVTITVAGFLDAADLELLVAERPTAYARLRCGPNRHVTLCDVTACLLQSQEVVAGFRGMIADPRWRSRRLAFVIGSSLARMQIRRMVAGRDDVRLFTDRDEAEAWLAEPEHAPVPPFAMSAAGWPA